MSKLIYKTGITISAALLLNVSCSVDQNEITLTDANVQVSEQTSGNSCSSSVDFGDMLIETSYDTEDTDDRDTYDACGIDGETWMDQYSDGSFMLKCLSGDSHRTELKEDEGEESNLKTYKRMRFTAKYSSLPSNGVTIAQIHSRASGIQRPWLRLYIDEDRVFKIKETETNPTGSSSSYTTYEAMDYTQNEEVQITIWTGIDGDEEAKIQIIFDGDTYNKTLSHPSAWNSYDDDFYLKAGVYTEGTDKQAKVTYSDFEMKY